MAEIDIGMSAESARGSGVVLDFYGTRYTYINEGNPANDSGTIDTVEIWMAVAGTGVKVAPFEEVDTDTFTTRDEHTLGNVASGSKQTFSGIENFNVATGDYLGIAGDSGTLDADLSGGAGMWRATGSYIPCTSQSFTALSGYELSLCGTGETVAVGWTHKYLGVANASIGKISGVAIADIKKVNGVE